MKRLVLYTLILVGCSSITKTKMEYSVFSCHIIDIIEYQYAFRFTALKGKDTISIISLKENYYNKYSYKKNILNHLEEIKINERYDFYLTQKKPIVSTMEQLGAVIIIENDTIWKSRTYKEFPLTYISHNTIGKFYSKEIDNAPNRVTDKK